MNGRNLKLGMSVCATTIVLFAASSLIAVDVVHRYDFEDEDGSDSVGDLDGSLVGSPFFSNDAMSGNVSIILEGNQYVRVTDPLDFGTQFSVALWVLPDSTALGIQTLIANTTPGDFTDGFKVFYNTWTPDSSTADGELILETGDGSRGTATDGDEDVVSDEVWTHVAVALDLDAGEAELYVDGDFYTSGDIISAMDTTSPFEIGRMRGEFDLHGQIDDVQIYDGVLAEDDVNWLFNHPGFVLGDAAPDELEAGDANQDLEFNFDDILQVLATNKFETGQVATWGEGDWNGAPGGSPGNPPSGDNLFNFDDILAALATGLFETGPYGAEAAGAGVVAIPEPHTGILLIFGLTFLAWWRWRRHPPRNGIAGWD